MKKQLYRIVIEGSYGSQWTGVQPQTGEVWTLFWLLKECVSGLSTRTLRGHRVESPVAALEEAFGPLPTAHIFVGGVNSVASRQIGSADLDITPYQGWDWNGRLAGNVVIDPLWVENGRVEEEELPEPQNGFGWIQTYYGVTLRSFALVANDDRHDLPEVVAMGEHIAPVFRPAKWLGSEKDPELVEVLWTIGKTAAKMLPDIPEGTRGAAHYAGAAAFKDAIEEAQDVPTAVLARAYARVRGKALYGDLPVEELELMCFDAITSARQNKAA